MSERDDALREFLPAFNEPGTVVAFEGDVCASPSRYHQILFPNATGLAFDIPLIPGMAELFQAGGEPRISVKSNMAQTGMDFLRLHYDRAQQRVYGMMKNVGPRVIHIPGDTAVPIGFLYRHSHEVLDALSVQRRIDEFNRVQTGSNRFFPIPHPKHQHTSAMYIEVKRSLRFPTGHEIASPISLNQLPRGTDRDALHRTLGIYAAELEQEVSALTDPEHYYALVETPEEIHYPRGWGILIIGGAFIYPNGAIEFFDHGHSVIGQHRVHGNGSKDPGHRLLAEFYMPPWIVEDRLRHDVRVGLVCEPISLYWVSKDGSPVL